MTGSVVNQLQIIEVMQQRDAVPGEQLVRERTGHLAEHVKEPVSREYQGVNNVTATESEDTELTDGFHLLLKALEMNGINTIYDLPGIPVTGPGRL